MTRKSTDDLIVPGLPGGSPLSALSGANPLSAAVVRSRRQRPEDEPEITIQLSEDGTTHHIIGAFDALQHKYYSPDPKDRMLVMRDAVILIAEENRYPRAVSGRPPMAPFGRRVTADIAMLFEDMAERRHNNLVRYAARPGRRGPTPDSHYIKEARTALGAAAEARYQYLKKFADPAIDISIVSACAWVIEKTDKMLQTADLDARVLFAPGEWDQAKPERIEQESPCAQPTDRVLAWRRKVISNGDFATMLQMQRQAPDADASLAIVTTFVHIAFERIVADTYDSPRSPGNRKR